MVKTSDDIQLIMDAQSGSRHALNQLATEVGRKVYPALYRMTRNHHLSSDLLQETLLVMLKSLKNLERIEGFWGWIHAIARSRVYDQFRKQQRRESEVYLDLDTPETDGDNTVVKSVIDKERDEFLAAAIGNLGKRYRDVVYFRHFENKSYSEIASMSHCTAQQARVRFCRAKHALREALCGTGFELDS